MRREYRIAVDIKHLDGPLAGLISPAGHALTFPTAKLAGQHASWLARVRDEGDFFRQTLTHNRVQPVGMIERSVLYIHR